MLPLLHGPMGEDGTVQGLLELADVPYVGAGVLGSALAMDKAMAKQVLAANGIAQARYRALRRAPDARPGLPDELAAELGLPCFVKPANMGSSVGVTKAHTVEELRDAIDHALTYDEWVVVEEAVVGREIEVAVLGNARPAGVAARRDRPRRRVLRLRGQVRHRRRPAADPGAADRRADRRGARAGRRVFQLLRCDGMARVDFFFEEGGRGFLCNEVNTMPGFTPISMYPKLWQAAGRQLPRADRPARRAGARAPRPAPPQHEALIASRRQGGAAGRRAARRAAGAGRRRSAVQPTARSASGSVAMPVTVP